MKRLSLRPTLILLALSTLGPAVVQPISDFGTASAEEDDRKDKHERLAKAGSP